MKFDKIFFIITPLNVIFWVTFLTAGYTPTSELSKLDFDFTLFDLVIGYPVALGIFIYLLIKRKSIKNKLFYWVNLVSYIFLLAVPTATLLLFLLIILVTLITGESVISA